MLDQGQVIGAYNASVPIRRRVWLILGLLRHWPSWPLAGVHQGYLLARLMALRGGKHGGCFCTAPCKVLRM